MTFNSIIDLLDFEETGREHIRNYVFQFYNRSSGYVSPFASSMNTISFQFYNRSSAIDYFVGFWSRMTFNSIIDLLEYETIEKVYMPEVFQFYNRSSRVLAVLSDAVPG